jgi:uncharacterized membrane protein YciS (DUF1049 family)
MSFASEASKIVTNKYFLYFVVFLSATNVLAYLAANKINAVIFFALVSLLSYQFSKNMAIVLLIAVVATNFLMANKGLREGLENATSEESTDKTAVERISETDEEIGKAIPLVKKAKNNEELNEKIEEKKETIDINNTDLNKSTGEKEPEGFSGPSSKKKNSENFGPRLDYAATIEESYQHLDSLLGSDSIKQLTDDTQKLMKQQQTLFNTMNQMVPVLEGAQGMLEKFDVNSLTQSLNSINNGIASGPIKKK